MTLKAEIKRRYSSDRLLNMSNIDDPDALIILEDRLDAAVDDTTGAFEACVGVSYDNTDKRHQRYAMKGVLLFLKLYGDTPGIESKIDAWEKQLEGKMFPVEAGAGFEPQTDGAFAPSQGEIGLPAFDRRNFDLTRLRAPRSINSDSDRGR